MFKNLKKKLTAILSLGLVLSTGAVMHAEAQEPTYPGTITINAPKDKNDTHVALTGMSANAYQVLTETVDEDGDKLYEVTDGFKGFFETAEEDYKTITEKTFYLSVNESGDLTFTAKQPSGAFITIELKENETLDANYFAASLLEKIKPDDDSGRSEDMEKLSNWLTNYVRENRVSTTQHNTAVENETSVTINNLPDGYYLVTYANVPQGIAVERSLVQVIYDNNGDHSVTIDMKADTQYVNKQVKHKNAKDCTYASFISANMSDTLTYQITMPVTQVTDATRVTSAVLTDTIQHHSFTKNSFTMKVVKDNEIGGGTTDVETYTYAYTADSESATFTKADGQEPKIIANVTFGTEENTNHPTFTITFTGDGIADLNALASDNNIKIVVTYDAVLGSDAVNENKNTANWTLGKGPYTYEGSDETLVYTYGIDIDKTFSDNQTTTHASSVQFDIYAGTVAEGNKLGVVKDSDGNYHVDNNSTPDSEVKLTPDSSGNLVLTGLKEGTYTLKEVATADDFQLAGDVTIILNADGTTKSELSTSSSATLDSKSILNKPSITVEAVTNISMLSMTILNQKGFNLPSTGGAGTWMFAIGGILLFAGAAAVLVAVTRKKDA